MQHAFVQPRTVPMIWERDRRPEKQIGKQCVSVDSDTDQSRSGRNAAKTELLKKSYNKIGGAANVDH